MVDGTKLPSSAFELPPMLLHLSHHGYTMATSYREVETTEDK